MDDEGKGGGGGAHPLWAARWHGREEIVALLGVSVRTLQRRVRSGDIERHEVPGEPPRYRPIMTDWTRRHIAARQGDRGGRHATRQGAPGGDAHAPSPGGAPPTTEATGATGQQGATHRSLSPHPSSEEILARLDAIERAISSERSSATQSDEKSPDGERGAERDKGAHEVPRGGWWRVLLFSTLARIKLMIDGWLAKLSA